MYRIMLLMAIFLCVINMFGCPLDIAHVINAENARQKEKQLEAIGGIDKLLSEEEHYVVANAASFNTIDLKNIETLALVRRSIGHYDKALKHNELAIKISNNCYEQRSIPVATNLVFRAETFCYMREFNEAISWAEKALDIVSEKMGVLSPEARKINDILCLIHIELNDCRGAERYIGRCSQEVIIEYNLYKNRLNDAEKLLETPPTLSEDINKHITYHTQCGFVLDAKGRKEEAANHLFKAYSFIEVLRDVVPLDMRQEIFSGWYAGGNLRPYRALIGLLADTGLKEGKQLIPGSRSNYEMAFFMAEAVKGRFFIETLLYRIGNLAKYSDKLKITTTKELVRKVDEFKDRRKELISQLKSYSIDRKNPPQELSNKITELSLEFITLYRELLQKAPLYGLLSFPRPLHFDEINLNEGDILLEYVIGKKACYLFKIIKGRPLQVYRLPICESELKRKITEFTEGIRDRSKDKYSVIGNELYTILLQPYLNQSLSDSKIIIIPDGCLGEIPFDALIIKKGKSFKDSVFVCDKIQITYYQSATIMTIKRLVKNVEAKKPLLAIGNPNFREERYCALNETNIEIEDIVKCFRKESVSPNDILLGENASKIRLCQAIKKDYRIIHFATHGDIKYGEPYLVLNQVQGEDVEDGYLRLSEVMEWQLNSNLVVLSACCTGQGQDKGGEGIINFARAFQEAGAKSVVVSLWKVDRSVPTKFMKEFYQEINNGSDKAKALRFASRKIREDNPHPYYWAVFVLYGEN